MVRDDLSLTQLKLAAQVRAAFAYLHLKTTPPALVAELRWLWCQRAAALEKQQEQAFNAKLNGIEHAAIKRIEGEDMIADTFIDEVKRRGGDVRNSHDRRRGRPGRGDMSTSTVIRRLKALGVKFERAGIANEVTREVLEHAAQRYADENPMPDLSARQVC